MRIGFDAKRAFNNKSGLGNYSRDLIHSLHKNFPDNEYVLFTPTIKNSIPFAAADKLIVIKPPANFGKLRRSYWRSFKLSGLLKAKNIEVFHGLSHELPYAIEKSGVKTVLTVHDLIFLRYPQWYGRMDRYIYKKKLKYSCRVADAIIAISEQTRNDLINLLGVNGSKIRVIYQGCNELFYTTVTPENKGRVRSQYHLPEQFMLYLGTIEERKNLLTIVKAIHCAGIIVPLVVVGKETDYLLKVKKYIQQNRLTNIHFLHSLPTADLPVIYQMAKLFIYPSVFEGFGIPILEALVSKVPVITSLGGCFTEVGGEHTVYVNPVNVDEMAEAIQQLLSNNQRCSEMAELGYLHALKFNKIKISKQIMDLYHELANERGY